jgi:hypothetical protein
MRKYTKKIICGLAVILIGLFIWNDSLYDKKPELPFTSEQVKYIFCLSEDFNTNSNLNLQAISDSNKTILLRAMNEMELMKDTELQEQVAKNQKPWWGEEVCKVEILLNTDFWHRTPSVTMHFFEDGHVMMQPSSSARPYPEVIDFDHEYTYLQYYKAHSENYDALVETICSVRDIYYKNYDTMYFKAENALWSCDAILKDDADDEQFDNIFQITYLGDEARIGEEVSFVFYFADEKSESLSFSDIWEEGTTSWQHGIGRSKKPIDYFIPETFIVEIGEDDDSRVEIEFVRTGEKTQ